MSWRGKEFRFFVAAIASRGPDAYSEGVHNLGAGSANLSFLAPTGAKLNNPRSPLYHVDLLFALVGKEIGMTSLAASLLGKLTSPAAAPHSAKLQL